MMNEELQKIAGEVAKVLKEQGWKRGLDEVNPKLQETPPRSTIGTAGKVFLNEPKPWNASAKVQPVVWKEDKKQECGCGSKSTAAPSIASLIDHTVLKPEAIDADIVKACEQAKQYQFATVCVAPSFVKLAAKCLKGSGVKVCTVVGFPLGNNTSLSKALEATDALARGAEEIDMVLNIGALKSGRFNCVESDIRQVKKACGDRVLKLILETCLLSREEKVKAAEIAQAAGADFVKTSTGFSSAGATVEDVALLRQIVGPGMGVKAAGGIRDFAFATQLVLAGANRIGCSASESIVMQERGSAKPSDSARNTY